MWYHKSSDRRAGSSNKTSSDGGGLDVSDGEARDSSILQKLTEQLKTQKKGNDKRRVCKVFGTRRAKIITGGKIINNAFLLSKNKGNALSMIYQRSLTTKPILRLG